MRRLRRVSPCARLPNLAPDRRATDLRDWSAGPASQAGGGRGSSAARLTQKDWITGVTFAPVVCVWASEDILGCAPDSGTARVVTASACRKVKWFRKRQARKTRVANGV